VLAGLLELLTSMFLGGLWLRQDLDYSLNDTGRWQSPPSQWLVWVAEPLGIVAVGTLLGAVVLAGSLRRLVVWGLLVGLVAAAVPFARTDWSFRDARGRLETLAVVPAGFVDAGYDRFAQWHRDQSSTSAVVGVTYIRRFHGGSRLSADGLYGMVRGRLGGWDCRAITTWRLLACSHGREAVIVQWLAAQRAGVAEYDFAVTTCFDAPVVAPVGGESRSVASCGKGVEVDRRV
jgi:hypothetical protein